MARSLGQTYARLSDRLEELSRGDREEQEDEKLIEERRILERHLRVVELRAKIASTAGVDFQRLYDCTLGCRETHLLLVLDEIQRVARGLSGGSGLSLFPSGSLKTS